MHPFWIQKIEESRKTAVTTFWVTMILVVIIPLMLVLKGDAFLILAMCCFTGAAIRLYWKNEKEYVEFSEGAKKEADAIAKHRQEIGVPAPELAAFQKQSVQHPEMIDENGNPLEPQYMAVPEAENFFQVSMENGEPIVGESEEEEVADYTQMDDMQLADPQTHPHPSRFQAARNTQQQQAPHVDAQQ